MTFELQHNLNLLIKPFVILQHSNVPQVSLFSIPGVSSVNDLVTGKSVGKSRKDPMMGRRYARLRASELCRCVADGVVVGAGSAIPAREQQLSPQL